jgi:Tfp pilus assembly protein PilF
MYLPMTMLALLATLNLNTVVSKYRFQSYGIILAVGLLLSLCTFQRNQVWSDPLTFYRDCAQKSPNKWRPMYNLGTNLGQRGLLEEAKTALEQAVVLRPDDSETHNQLANVFMMQQQTASAEKHYRLAIKHNPKNAEALYNLATILAAQNRYAEQKKVLEQFVQFAPFLNNSFSLPLPISSDKNNGRCTTSAPIR